MNAYIINIVLVGRTGNGKSATGNTILGQGVFRRFGAGATNENDRIDSMLGETLGVPIRVIDATGIGDSVEDTKVKLTDSLDYLSKRLPPQTNGDDFSILVLVLKLGTRFTEQEKKSVSDIRRLFGEDCFRNFGLIVFTCGDQFDCENGDFRTWCASQSGEFGALYNECNKRCVLFDNVTAEGDTKQRQLQHFLSLVENIKSSSGDGCLRIDEDGKQSLIEDHTFPETQQSIAEKLRECDEIMRQMGKESKISLEKLVGVRKKLQDLKKILHRFRLHPGFDSQLTEDLENLIKRNVKLHESVIRCGIVKERAVLLTIILLAAAIVILLVYLFTRY